MSRMVDPPFPATLRLQSADGRAHLFVGQLEVAIAEAGEQPRQPVSPCGWCIAPPPLAFRYTKLPGKPPGTIARHPVTCPLPAPFRPPHIPRGKLKQQPPPASCHCRFPQGRKPSAVRLRVQATGRF